MAIIGIYLSMGLILWIASMTLNWIDGDREFVERTLSSFKGVIYMPILMVAWPIALVSVGIEMKKEREPISKN